MAFSLTGSIASLLHFRKLDSVAQTKNGIACQIAKPLVCPIGDAACPPEVASQPFRILEARLEMAGLESADRRRLRWRQPRARGASRMDGGIRLELRSRSKFQTRSEVLHGVG